MPSQYRHGEFGSVQMHSQFSYATPCTPQAHCRYEPAVDLSYPSSFTPLSFQDTESWFPGTGFEATTTTTMTTTGNGSPTEFYNFQQPSELPVGSADDMGSSVDLWSPSMNCTRAVPADIVTTLQGRDVKPTVNGVPNPVTVASAEVDLNAPAGTAVVVPPRRKAAVPRPSSSTGALGKTKGTKAKGAKGGRGSGKSVSAPVSPSEMRRSSAKSTLAVQKTSKKGHACKPGEAKLRVVSQRENHIWSERERRKGMNYLFNTLRSLLPHPVDKTDKSTVVGEIIKYIQSLQVKLEVMTTKQQVMIATRSSGFHSSAALPKVMLSNGLTLVDHSSDPTSMTAVTALPPPGKESCLQSFLGTNVGIHVCGRNVFITTSSPRGRCGLFQELLVTIHKHELDIINATISTSTASVFHCLHCQASQDGELLNHDLHSALQRVIANYGSQFYES